MIENILTIGLGMTFGVLFLYAILEIEMYIRKKYQNYKRKNNDRIK